MNNIKFLRISELNHNLEDNDFYANTIPNHLISNHSRIEKPHKHDFYAVFLFTQGTGFHEIDFQIYEIKPGAVFFLYPGQTHSWTLSEDIDGFLFFHSKEFYDLGYVTNSIKDYPFFQSNHTAKCFYLDEKTTQTLKFLLKEIYLEYKSNFWKRNQLILSYLTQSYIKINRFIEEVSPVEFSQLRHYQFIFNQFENILEENYMNVKLASEYATKLNITQKHLNRVVKSITTKTTTDIILDRIILEAKRMLIYTDKSFSEIANQLGYYDYAYFSKIFKKRVGLSPSEFVNRYGTK